MTVDRRPATRCKYANECYMFNVNAFSMFYVYPIVFNVAICRFH